MLPSAVQLQLLHALTGAASPAIAALKSRILEAHVSFLHALKGFKGL